MLQILNGDVERWHCQWRNMRLTAGMFLHFSHLSWKWLINTTLQVSLPICLSHWACSTMFTVAALDTVSSLGRSLTLTEHVKCYWLEWLYESSWLAHTQQTHVLLLTDPLQLTSLVGGDVDCGVAGWDGVSPRHPVDGLHLETVACVSLQVPHHYLPLPQPQPARSDVHVVVTARARDPVLHALLTHHVIDQVAPPACVLRLVPLQGQRGLVHAGYNIAWRWGDGCAHTHTHTHGCLKRWVGEAENTQLSIQLTLSSFNGENVS